MKERKAMLVRAVMLLVATVVAVPAGVSAAGGSLGLDEALKLALEKNHLLRAALHERAAAERELAISRGRYLPRVSLEETAAVSNAPTRVFMMKLDEGRFTQNDFLIPNLNHPASHGDFRTAVTLEQPLLDFGIGRRVELAREEDAAQGHVLERRRQEVAFRVYTAFLDVQRARAYLRVAEQAVADAREHQRLATVRGEAGVGLKSDELRARTFLSEMEQQSITAHNDWQLAKLRLAQAVGGEAGESVDIREELAAPVLTLGEGELQRLALQNRPDLKEVELAVARAAAGVRLARSAYLPTIYGNASYQMNDRDIPFGRDNDAWSVGATLRWELFDGLQRGNGAEKARLQQQAADEYLAQYRSEVALQVSEGYLRRGESGKRLEVARHAFLAAEEGMRLLSRRFENSIATMVELLDAQSALNRARANLVENETNYARSTAQLYHAAGTFLKEVVK